MANYFETDQVFRLFSGFKKTWEGIARQVPDRVGFLAVDGEALSEGDAIGSIRGWQYPPADLAAAMGRDFPLRFSLIVETGLGEGGQVRRVTFEAPGSAYRWQRWDLPREQWEPQRAVIRTDQRFGDMVVSEERQIESWWGGHRSIRRKEEDYQVMDLGGFFQFLGLAKRPMERPQPLGVALAGIQRGLGEMFGQSQGESHFGQGPTRDQQRSLALRPLGLPAPRKRF